MYQYLYKHDVQVYTHMYAYSKILFTYILAHMHKYIFIYKYTCIYLYT